MSLYANPESCRYAYRLGELAGLYQQQKAATGCFLRAAGTRLEIAILLWPWCGAQFSGITLTPNAAGGY